MPYLQHWTGMIRRSDPLHCTLVISTFDPSVRALPESALRLRMKHFPGLARGLFRWGQAMRRRLRPQTWSLEKCTSNRCWSYFSYCTISGVLRGCSFNLWNGTHISLFMVRPPSRDSRCLHWAWRWETEAGRCGARTSRWEPALCPEAFRNGTESIQTHL